MASRLPSMLSILMISRVLGVVSHRRMRHSLHGAGNRVEKRPETLDTHLDKGSRTACDRSWKRFYRGSMDRKRYNEDDSSLVALIGEASLETCWSPEEK
jgi:hypothetical protein